MKLKNITLIAIVIFVGVFIVLMFIAPSKKPNLNKNTDLGVTNTSTSNSPKENTNNNVALTMQEISTHSDSNSCYLLIKDSVYDVTSYIGEHPGGKRKILNKCGQEVTSVFASIHSNFAWNLLSDYYVGHLVK